MRAPRLGPPWEGQGLLGGMLPHGTGVPALSRTGDGQSPAAGGARSRRAPGTANPRRCASPGEMGEPGTFY